MNLVILFLSSGGGVENVFGDAAILRIFRLMRLTRLLRMARLIRMVPELLIMVKAVASAARSVGFTLILLGICLYVYAIVFRLLLEGQASGTDYFENVLVSMHSLFMHGTLLDSVSDLMTDLRRDSWVAFILMYFFIISPTELNAQQGFALIFCGWQNRPQFPISIISILSCFGVGAFSRLGPRP